MKITIVQTRSYHYRVPFYNALRSILSARGHDLDVLYSDPLPQVQGRDDTQDIPWAHKVSCRYYGVGRFSLIYQDCMPYLKNSALIIVQQESKLLLNYQLLYMRRYGSFRLAFWGHGRTYQTGRFSGLGENWKRFFLRRPDWWFAYTSVTSDYLVACGYPAKRITVVQNATDTHALMDRLASITEEEQQQARRTMGLQGKHVGLFVGSLYAEKQIGLLVEAVDVARASVPDLELLVIGAGPEEAMLKRLIQDRPWIYYCGVLQGRDLAICLKLAKILLLPGAVGLAVLDGFAAGLPLLTTNVPTHGPEIAYLHPEENGIMTSSSATAFGAAIGAILQDTERYQYMRNNCLRLAGELSSEKMADNFAAGIEDALR